jgi:two-component system, cell cycle response regulator
MSFRLKVNLVLLLAGLLIMLPGGWYINNVMREQANHDIVKQADMLMESALASRSYTVDLVKPQLDPMLAEKFLPQTVPAFAATEIFERFRKRFANFKYKEAVLDPTNPRDLADDQEREIIKRFVADPSLKEASGELFRNLDRIYYVAKPIQIKNPACLACHDTPERAPQTMRAIYGDKGGFGWKKDQIVGAQIIVVPAYEQDKTTGSLLKVIAGVVIAMFLAMVVVVNLLVRDGDA